MEKYHKIQTVYKRNPETNFRTLLEGHWATPELAYLQDNGWVFTEKVDGTNIRVIWRGTGDVAGSTWFEFRGKTDRAQIPVFLSNQLHRTFDVRKFVELYPDTPMTLYGEGYGAKIQKGGGNYIKDGVDFILFDVKVGDFWLRRENMRDIADSLGIKVVPVVGMGTLKDAVRLVRGKLTSVVAENEDFPAEGLIMRPAQQLFNRHGKRIIAKVKYKDFER